ncbi:MAG: polyprenol monophosphomannose synthase [Deltaproteobacteria bacterium]|nr:polyprenol monophosphomannose synthase [Deltaproteobacteria bacterium]
MPQFKDNTIICLPTYNEADTLPVIVGELTRILPEAGILVIDDNSPDHTGDIAERLAEKNPGLSVLHRSCKQGLGPAYMDAFKYITAASPGPEYIVQMDADLSHPCECLPEMLNACKTADLIIGSRYVPGGGTENWDLARRCISRFGSFYANGLLGFRISDLTSGFKVWRKEILAQILKFPVHAAGYAFQIETTFIASCLGARIIEFPILFTDRNLGRSKMTAAIALEAFWYVPLLRLRKKRYRHIALKIPEKNGVA